MLRPELDVPITHEPIFYQVQDLPRGSEFWVGHRRLYVTYEEALVELTEFRTNPRVSDGVYRIIKCEVLDD